MEELEEKIRQTSVSPYSTPASVRASPPGVIVSPRVFYHRSQTLSKCENVFICVYYSFLSRQPPEVIV